MAGLFPSQAYAAPADDQAILAENLSASLTIPPPEGQLVSDCGPEVTMCQSSDVKIISVYHGTVTSELVSWYTETTVRSPIILRADIIIGTYLIPLLVLGTFYGNQKGDASRYLD